MKTPAKAPSLSFPELAGQIALESRALATAGEARTLYALACTHNTRDSWQRAANKASEAIIALKSVKTINVMSLSDAMHELSRKADAAYRRDQIAETRDAAQVDAFKPVGSHV